MIGFAPSGFPRPEPAVSGPGRAGPPVPGSSPSEPASCGLSGPAGPASTAPAASERPSAAAVRTRRKRLGRLGDEIARLSAHLQAATYRLLAMIREFDEQEGWHEEGFKSCAQWLSWRTGIAPGAAREKVRVARALGRLPCLSEALRTGRLSYSAARALTRVATPENEAELADVARHTPAAQLERLVRGWRAADRAEDREREQERHARRELWVLPEADGSWVIRGRLDPEVGAVVCRALEAAAEALYAGGGAEPESPSEARRADALGLVAEAALGGGLGARAEDGVESAREAGADAEGEAKLEEAATNPEPGAAAARPVPAPVVGRAERFQVVVHVSAETLAGDAGTGGDDGRAGAGGEDGDSRGSALGPGESRIAGGPHVSAETSRRLACDAGVVVMTHDRAGNVLDVGRRTRSVPPAIRRALDRRDGGCRFPGCASRYCDAHHLRHWTHGGATKLDNLALLCRRHHRLLHEGGWRAERREGGEVRFYRPDGRLLPQVPAPCAVGEAPVAALVRAQRELEIDPWTPTPRWHGERLDLDWALFTLRRLPTSDVSAETSATDAPGAAR